MAISVFDKDDYKSRLIPHYIDGDSEQLDPCFAAFKRIHKISARNYKSNNLNANLQLISKYSVRIDSLIVNEDIHDKARKFYKDKEVNLVLKLLEVKLYKDNISNEDVEFINKINPKILEIRWEKWTVQNIKELALLNWMNILAKFDYIFTTNSYFWFENTPIQLFDSQSSQMLAFEWKSIKFFIEESKTKKIKLLKTCTDYYLIIPLKTIGRIMYSGFREILSTHDINKQFAYLSAQYQFDTDEFIVPMRYSNRIFIEFNDVYLDYLTQMGDIFRIFKEKHINLTIKSLNKLLEINQLLPDDFLCINFTYHDPDTLKIAEDSISEIIDNPDWSNLKFWEIYKASTLSFNEFQFWWKMLRSRRTRFNLFSINLKLSLLSECLTILSLCSDCPKLKSISLEYVSDFINDYQFTVELAEKKFRQKFGFIQKLEIWEGYKDYELQF